MIIIYISFEELEYIHVMFNAEFQDHRTLSSV